MAIKARFNGARWRDEFNSEAFISGLEAAINYTKTHGNETGFNVHYDPACRSFLFPDEIWIGTPTKITLLTSLNAPQVAEAYKKETGLVAPGTREFRDQYKQVSMEELGEALERYKTWEKEFFTKNPILATNIPYPNTPDKIKRDIDAGKAVNMDDENSVLSSEIIHVHTHPGRDVARPSGADIRAINSIRGINYNGSMGEISVNPVAFIVGTKDFSINGKEHYSVFAMQGRAKKLLPDEAGFDNLSLGMRYNLSSQEKFLKSVFGPNRNQVLMDGCVEAAKKNFVFSEGVYIPAEKRIHLFEGFNIFNRY